MWWTLDKKLVQIKYSILIKDMYTNIMIYVKTYDGDSDIF
jgi:hypothetical protein